MRKVINPNLPSEVTEVVCLDEPGQGGMCHEYIVQVKDQTALDVRTHTNIHFQNGPVKEHGINGCLNEDLILVVLDRLRGAQAGDFSCRENALAITKLEEALLWLNFRTNSRVHRGVEGTNKE